MAPFMFWHTGGRQPTTRGRSRSAQPESADFAVADCHGDEHVVRAVLELQLPQVNRVTLLVEHPKKAGSVALSQARPQSPADAVEHRLGHARLERRIACCH